MLLRFLVLTLVAALLPAYAQAGGHNPMFTMASAISATTVTQTQTPYLGTTWALPGRVEAEHFDDGGQNVAYFDSDGIANTYFRAGDVDMEFATGGRAVKLFKYNEWLEFTVNVARTGAYDVSFYIGAATYNQYASVRMEVDGVVAISNTSSILSNSFLSWGVVNGSAVLTKGQHVIRIKNISAPDLWFDWFEATLVDGAPTVNITGPTAGQQFTLGTRVTFAADATDQESSVTKVEFYRDGVLAATTNAPDFYWHWYNAPAGTYVLTAKAFDTGNLAEVSAPVTFYVGNRSPIVALTSPVTGSVVNAPANLTLAASASDPDGSISKVEFYNGTALLNTDTVAPFTYAWNGIAAGNYTLKAKAYDNSTGTATSTDVLVTVNAMPTAAITNPGAGAVVGPPPATIPIAATATDSDGTITKVEFYNGSTLLATDTTSPYDYSWTNVAAGTYTLYARSYDNRNAMTTSSPSVIVVNVPPTVSWTSPANNAVFHEYASFSLSVNASDSDGSIAKVEFYQGTTLLGTDTASPYSYNVTNLGQGTYSFSAKAFDNRGTVTTAALSVRVNRGPAVSLTSPATGSLYPAPASITLAATASDTDGTVTKVDFLKDGALLQSVSSPPYSYTWSNVAAGTYSITAKAYDNDNATTTSSASAITVVASQPPSVTLDSPANNATFPKLGLITLDASASDSDGTIKRVEFYRGSTLIDTDTTKPYAVAWPNAAPGTYALRARAIDNSDVAADSTQVTVTVTNNQLPVVTLTKPETGQSTDYPVELALEATASDPDGTITKVEFFAGDTLLFSDASAPFQFDWIDAKEGSYEIFAVAHDAAGATARSNAATVTVGLHAAYSSIVLNSVAPEDYNYPNIRQVCGASGAVPIVGGTAARGTSEPGQARLTPGRYMDPNVPGHGWDFFWYTEDAASGNTNRLQQNLFVTFYTHRLETDGTHHPVWYGAKGNVVTVPGDPSHLMGFEGELLEYRQLPEVGEPWGYTGSVSKLNTTGMQGAVHAGWIKLAFTVPLDEQITDPDSVGVWWQLDNTARVQRSTTRFDGSVPSCGDGIPCSVFQCLKNFGVQHNLPPATDAGMAGRTGSWWLDRQASAGVALMSYFYQSLEHQVLLYFQNTESGALPRWAHAVPLTSDIAGTTHPCVGHGYSVAGVPTTASTELCLLDLNGLGYDPDGYGETDPWDPITGQQWAGTLTRSYSESDPSRGTLSLTSASIPINGATITNVPIRKRVSVHRLHVDQVDTAGAATPVESTCNVATTGDAAGYCDLRLHWVTNNFTSAAVFMHRLTNGQPSGERILVRASEPMTPTDGFPYPPRGGANSPTLFGGIGAGEAYQFELYSHRDLASEGNAAELLAKTGPITGAAPAGCTTATAPTALAPNNTNISFRRPLFRFTLAAAGKYRIKLSESPVAGTERYLGEFSGNAASAGSQLIELPNHLNGLFRMEGARHKWTVEALGSCGPAAAPAAYFNFGELTIADAPGPASSPTYVSDQTPVPGELPMAVSVSGGAASAELPITVPPGRHGMQPSLALAYTSRGGNGVAGLGWSVTGVSSIHRCPQTMDQDDVVRPVHIDGEDRLCLDGQRLVATYNYGRADTVYRLELDDWTRVTQRGGDLLSLNTTFLVELRSGEIQEFGGVSGTPDGSRALVSVPTAAGSQPRVLSWNIRQRRDRVGNTVNYAYQTYGTNAGETLIKTISYTGRGADQGNRLVEFSYLDRPSGSSGGDRSSAYLGGARIAQTQRLTSVQTRISGRNVGIYTLDYGTQSLYSSRSVLRSVEHCAYDENGSNSSCLPKVRINWQEQRARAQFGLKNLGDLSAVIQPPPPPAGTEPERIYNVENASLAGGDIDGDGVVETIIRIGRGFDASGRIVNNHYIANLRADRSAPQVFAIPSDWSPEGFHPDMSKTDLNSDGRADLHGRKYVVPRDRGTYNQEIVLPFNDHFRVLEWAGTNTDWALSSFTETVYPIDIPGRIEWYYDSFFQKYFSVELASLGPFLSDVDGDGDADLILRRVPPSASDPLAQSSNCADDGRGVPGDELVVFRNTTAVSGSITFDTAPAYRECLQGDAVEFGTYRRRQYPGVSVKDIDGDGIDDLVVSRSGNAPLVRFGTRTTTSFAWDAGRSLYDLEPSDDVRAWAYNNQALRPSVERLELDANGDGLTDLLFRNGCKGEFLRLNTGSKLLGKTYTTAIQVAPRASYAAANCNIDDDSTYRARGATTVMIADFDSDGRDDLLEPYDFAVRMCVLASEDSAPRRPIDGEEQADAEEEVVDSPDLVNSEIYYFCPEKPIAGVGAGDPRLIPPVSEHPTLNGIDMRSMYEHGMGRMDDSLYHARATRFVESAVDPATQLPTYSVQRVTDTGIVMRARKIQWGDFYGDGLAETFGHHGCHHFFSRTPTARCALLSSNSSTAPDEPTTGSWGPTAFPNGQPFSYGFFISENRGADPNPQFDAPSAPTLPDMVRSVEWLGESTSSVLRRASWTYSPLSSRAGRAADGLPLYSIPARSGGSTGYIDAQHFYFTSSMPVVDMFTQSTADDLDGHRKTYGYQEAMFNNRGRGFRGFRKIVEEDWITELRTTTQFEQKFPLTSKPVCTAVSRIGEGEDCSESDGDAPLGLEEIEYAVNPTLMGGCRVMPQPVQSCNAEGVCYTATPQCIQFYGWSVEPSVVRSENRDPLTRERLLTETTIENTYEARLNGVTWQGGRLTRQVSTTTDHLGVNPAGRDQVVVRKATRDLRYADPDVSSWWLDKVTSTTNAAVTSIDTSSGQSTETSVSEATTTRVLGYDAATRQVSCEGIYRGNQNVSTCLNDRTHSNWESTTSTTAYDVYGNPTSVTVAARALASDRTTSTDYTSTIGYFPSTVAAPHAHVTRSTFDDRFGLPKAVTNPQLLTTTTSYDAFGRAVRIDAPTSGAKRMAPTQWVARQWCRGSICVNAAGASMRTVAEQPGTPTQIDYVDRLGRSIRTETSGFAAGTWDNTTKAWDDRGLLIAETAPASGTAIGAVTLYHYDDYGRRVLKHVERNDLDQWAAVTGGDLFTRYEHSGHTTQITLCRSGTLTSCTNPSGVIEPVLTMSRTMGSSGAAYWTIDAKNAVTTYAYDALGNAKAITDATGHTVSAIYDEFGRRLSMSDPSRGTWSFTYNGLGELLTQTDARNVVQTYARDDLGRLKERTWTESDRFASHDMRLRCMKDAWTYDLPRTGLLHEESRVRVQSGAGCQSGPAEQLTKTYAYDETLDPFFRPTEVTTRATVSTKTRLYSTKLRYDGNYGRPNQRILPDGVAVYSTYNARGDLIEEGFSDGFAGPDDPRNEYLRRVASVDARGRPTKILYASGTQSSVTRYDESSGLTLETCAQSGNASSCSQALTNAEATSNKWMDIGYRYDVFGNVLEQRYLSGRVPRSDGTTSSSPIAETYAYDELHRLTTSNFGSEVSYGYDALGNLRFKTDFSAAPVAGQAWPYKYETAGKPHSVSSVKTATGDVSYGYDANGNMTQRLVPGTLVPSYPNLFVEYDGDNLPLEIRHVAEGDNRGVAFRYGPDKQRYFEQDSSVAAEIRYRWYVDKVFESDEITANADQFTESRYYIAPDVLYVKDTRTANARTGVYYVHADRLGSTTVISNEAGLISTTSPQLPLNENNAEQFAYTAFGGVFNAWGVKRTRGKMGLNPRGFTQHEHLEANGLIHMNGRSYDPQLGRFLSVDPYIQFPLNSQSLNPYSYLLNNPLFGTDPTGYKAWIYVCAGPACVDVDTDGNFSLTDEDPNRADFGFGVDSIQGKRFDDLSLDITWRGATRPAEEIDVTWQDVAQFAWDAAQNIADRKMGMKGRSRSRNGSSSQAMADRGSTEPAAIGRPSDGSKKEGPPTGRGNVDHAESFDKAREKAFENAGLTDPEKVSFSKEDPETGTIVEFKGPNGEKVAYDGPHADMDASKGHDKPHVGWQSAGKRSSGGGNRGNITYDGPQHPSRPDQKPDGIVIDLNKIPDQLRDWLL